MFLNRMTRFVALSIIGLEGMSLSTRLLALPSGVLAMESSEESSSDTPSSASETKQEPDKKEEEGAFVFPPPHFAHRNKSESDFSPPSESSEEEEQSPSSSEDGTAAWPHHPQPPTSRQTGYYDKSSHSAGHQDNSDVESGAGSGMESVHVRNSLCVPAPYQLDSTRRRTATSVDYKQFYRKGGNGSEGEEEEYEESKMNWKRRGKVCHVRLPKLTLPLDYCVQCP